MPLDSQARTAPAPIRKGSGSNITTGSKPRLNPECGSDYPTAARKLIAERTLCIRAGSLRSVTAWPLQWKGGLAERACDARLMALR